MGSERLQLPPSQGGHGLTVHKVGTPPPAAALALWAEAGPSKLSVRPLRTWKNPGEGRKGLFVFKLFSLSWLIGRLTHSSGGIQIWCLSPDSSKGTPVGCSHSHLPRWLGLRLSSLHLTPSDTKQDWTDGPAHKAPDLWARERANPLFNCGDCDEASHCATPLSTSPGWRTNTTNEGDVTGVCLHNGQWEEGGKASSVQAVT